MTSYIKKYSELTSDEILQIENLIKIGGEIDPKFLSDRLSKTEHISFFKVNDEVISTASIKVPTEDYRKDVFAKSKSNKKSDDFSLELGYVSTAEKFQRQRLASKLCDELCKLYSQNKIFSTTRIDNESMKSILSKNNFEEEGIKYLNKKKSNFLKLYIKN